MKSRVGIWLLAGLLGGSLLSAGCRNRNDNASGKKDGGQVATAEKTNSPSSSSYVVVATVSRPDDKYDWPHRVEVHETYKLAAGATVDVSRFNGRIVIETAEGDEADLYLVRSSNEKDTFKQRKLIVDHSPEKLALRMERANRSIMFEIFSDHDQERQRLILRLPRKVDLNIESASGRMKVGEVDGEISIENVSGQIELARASEGTKIESVNGHVTAQVSGLKEQGLKIEGVNGRVTLQVAGDLNADLEISGVNGRIEFDLPNFKPSGEPQRGHVEGQIGKGGSPLEISGVNGGVWVGAVGKGPNMAKPEAAAEVKTVDKKLNGVGVVVKKK
jgi:hypothetical protein